LLLLLSAQTALAQLSAPKLTPVPTTESQTARIREGAALHDKGDFDAAISKYQEVLKENPDNVVAIYELTFAYYAKKDYAKALEHAYRGAQYKSNQLGGFYTVIGNVLDTQGNAQKAVEVYKSGIKLMPDEGLLYFNLAITQRGMGKLEDARKSAKRAVVFSPEHKSSHLLLATLFHNGQYKTPALLAVLRFLTLEPRTERSVAALKIAQQVLQGGVSAGKSSNEINIFVDLSAKKDEGDFGSIDLMMGLTKANSMSEKNKGKTEAELLADQFSTFLAILSEMDGKKLQSNFTGKYYAPYFIEMKRRNYVEPFIYYTHQRSNLAGVPEWLQQNSARVDEFLNWTKNYRWPRVE
jgi:tetratricopeptide (TPR) repeat protein